MANDAENEGIALSLRFAGLNLFVKDFSGYRILVTDARAATNGRDRAKLHRHTPYLVVQKGNLSLDGVAEKPFRGKWPCRGRFEGLTLDFVELTGNFEFRLSPPPTNGSASINEPGWLPRLGDVEARIDQGANLMTAPVAATFIVRRGEFKPGGRKIRVSWKGNHIGHNPPEFLYEWTELVYTVKGEKVRLERPGRDWLLTPSEGENEIIAWVGNAADVDCDRGADVHAGHGSGNVIEHFKWLYEHAGLGPEPITDLAHPVTSQGLAYRPETLTSTFCPDGQYP